jgi:hypothetical protein
MRILLAAPLAASLFLAGCAGQTSAQVTAAVASDVHTLAAALSAELPAATSVANAPAAQVSALEADVADIEKLSGQITTTMTAAAAQPTVQSIETDVNGAVAAASDIPGLPAQVTIALQAAQALLPVIEAGVNLFVPAGGALHPAMAPDAALLVLKVDAAK